MSLHLNWRVLRSSAVTMFALVWTSTAAAHECPTFSGREWTFTGRLVNRVFAGPPDYESVTSGDQPVTRWYLQLPWPACFAEYQHLTRIQLALVPQEVDMYRRFLGKQVTVEGTLEKGTPGRHTTSLVMNVASLVTLRRE